jgi:hypothetical protein
MPRKGVSVSYDDSCVILFILQLLGTYTDSCRVSRCSSTECVGVRGAHCKSFQASAIMSGRKRHCVVCDHDDKSGCQIHRPGNAEKETDWAGSLGIQAHDFGGGMKGVCGQKGGYT